jgi:DNA-binding MarR family transcriptional regulator
MSPDTDQRPVSELSQEVVRLTRASNAVRAHLAATGGQGVEWSTYLLLFHLLREGPLRSSALAEAVHVDPSTVSRQVAQLVKAGLAERRADPGDGRACLLVPTEKGQRLSAALKARRDEAFARVLTDWSTEDVRLLTGLLGRLNDSLTAHRAHLLEALTAGEPPEPPTEPRTEPRTEPSTEESQ